MIDAMKFTTDWVSAREEAWRNLFAGWELRPVRFLELGFYEGRSAQWWLKNVLVHPDSELVCVDRWPSKGLSNLAEIYLDPAYRHKIAFFREDAIAWVANTMSHRFCEFDAVYIDFSKEGADILAVASMVIRMVNPGGIILFDDYAWKWSESSNMQPPRVEPRVGIDAFLDVHAPFLTDIQRGPWQAWARVVGDSVKFR